MAFVVVERFCINCGACENECPTECITMTDRGAVIDGNRCIECGACSNICPTDAPNPE